MGYYLAHRGEEKWSRVPAAPSLWASKWNSGIIMISDTKHLTPALPLFCALRGKRNSPGVLKIALPEKQSTSQNEISFCCTQYCQFNYTSNYIPTLKKKYLPASGTLPLTMLCLVSAMKWSSSCWSTVPCPSQPYRTSPPSKSRPSTKGTRSERLFETGKISSWSMNSWEKMLLPSKSRLWRLCSFTAQESGWKGTGGRSRQEGESGEDLRSCWPLYPCHLPPSAHWVCRALWLQWRTKARSLLGGCPSRLVPDVPTQEQTTTTAIMARSWGWEGAYRKLQGRNCSSSFLSCLSTGNWYQYPAYFTRSV